MTSTAEEILTNEAIQVFIHRKPFCLIELQVKGSKPLIDQARKEAVKNVNKEVSLPGFRKGKAPDQTILKRYPQEVERQMHKTLANVCYSEAQKLARIPLLNRNAQVSFELKNLTDETAELVFSFETEPVVPTVDPQKFLAKPVKKAEVGEKEIDEAIRQMQFFFADWKPIQDRPIQDGDYIMIDLDTIEEDGQTKNVFHHIRFEVSKARMADWMKKLVQGAKEGDILEGLSEADADATEEEKSLFVPKKVRLSIIKAEEAILPELTDEFAQKVGAKTVQEMRESITKMLTDQAEEGAKQSLRDQVNEFLTAEYTFDPPKSLIETEQAHRKEQMLKDASFRVKWEKEMSGAEKSALDEKLFQESLRAVSLFYLARAIVHQANLPITHQEVQREAISTLRSLGQTKVEPDHIPQEVFALALSKVILAKAEEYVIEMSSKTTS